MRCFEEMFPFEETGDQLLAIEATKSDMESPRIMDRLICGDVLDRVKPRRKDVEIAAVAVLDLDIILYNLVYLNLLDPLVDTESVVFMDNVIPHFQIRKILDLLTLVRRLPSMPEISLPIIIALQSW